MLVTLIGKLTFCKAEQFTNVLISISFTLVGIVISVSLEHPSNAPPPMLTNSMGKMTLFNEEQFLKAFIPMLMTLFRRVTLLSSAYPRNASLGMRVTFR